MRWAGSRAYQRRGERLASADPAQAGRDRCPIRPGFAPFTVAQSSAPATLPTPAATVSAIDFGFRGVGTLRDGELVRFQNEGYLIHMILFARMKSAADAKKGEALLL
jgi:hypothetical protein